MSLVLSDWRSRGFAVDRQGRRHDLPATLFMFEPGDGYYCEIAEFHGHKIANPKFRVLDLPTTETSSEIEYDKDPADSPSDNSSSLNLNPILEKWGKK